MSSISKSSSPQNSAAWLVDTKVKPLEVKPAKYTHPKAGEIVIRNRAVAINPVDRMKQEMGDMLYGWVKYPLIWGSDLAGEVFEVGPNVTQFKVGDRVLGLGLGNEKNINSSSGAAFQNYTIVLEQVVAKIPDSMTFEEAASLPLGMSTAICGLFQENQLGLQYPATDLKPKPTGQTLLVWGASSSVGSNAVQLAVAAGYEVVAVCGAHNFEYAKKIGASICFDYRSKTVVKDLTAAFKDRISAGCISCGAGGPEACLEVFAKVRGSKKVAFAAFPLPDPMPKTFVLPRLMWSMAGWWMSFIFWSTLRGVKSSTIWGSTMAFNGLSKVVYHDFLQQALAKGKYVAAPQPHIVGHGLEFIQEAYNELGRGVSAKKLVVTL